jgi:hypothetical protein
MNYVFLCALIYIVNSSQAQTVTYKYPYGITHTGLLRTELLLKHGYIRDRKQSKSFPADMEYKVIYESISLKIYECSLTISHADEHIGILIKSKPITFNFMDKHKDSIEIDKILRGKIKDSLIAYIHKLGKELHQSNRTNYRLIIKQPNKKEGE